MPAFVAHNIAFADGTESRPGAPLLAEAPFTQAVLRSLALALPPSDRGASSIIDLGCLEGGYTVEFARHGYDALGLEVRELNIGKCRYVEQRAGLDNLRFVRADARDLADFGTFDAVFCAGLLYHLDDPIEFVRLLGQVTKRVLILDTHVAMARRPRYWRKRLSRMAVHEGVPGRWYDDYPDAASPESMESAVDASYGNPRSFWVEKMHLIQELREAGFSTVYEQFDCLANVVDNVRLRMHDRVLLVALK